LGQLAGFWVQQRLNVRYSWWIYLRQWS